MLIALAALTVFVGLHAPAHPASLRCLSARVPTGALPLVTPAEAMRIEAIWHDLDDAGGGEIGGSGGPLGCPLGAASEVTDAGWTGVSQKFQRGWILVGRGASAGSELASVRGLGGWTVWWTGLPGDLVVAEAGLVGTFENPPAQSAGWVHGGVLRIAAPYDNIALWACAEGSCERVTPWMKGSARLFDAAARLLPRQLATPAADADIVPAIFPPWLPCYTRVPIGDSDPGEGILARATVKMRRTAPCPLTLTSPSTEVVDWLKTLTFPAERAPGTTVSDWVCVRLGDLDVHLVQLLHLVLENKGVLDATTLLHIGDVLLPYGGKPRASPYVTDYSCLGYDMIESENHILLQETARYLINDFLSARGLGSKYDNVANRDWMLRFLQQLARRDFYEFNAIPYTRYQLKALFQLNRHALDVSVQTAARGMLHWLFAKQAVSGNLDRDHRPFRRIPESRRYANAAWWGSATTATTAETALLVGPIQHVHPDIDLQLDRGLDETQVPAFTAINDYPELAVASEDFLAEFIDVTDQNYRLPDALSGWLTRRFTADEANRVTYLQAIHHASPIADDRNLFAQVNGGAELMSGNRNWTIIAGGTPVAPGDPGPPPQGPISAVAIAVAGLLVGTAAGSGIGFAVGGPVGGVVGAIAGGVFGLIAGIETPDMIAAGQQHDALWDTQPAVLRETTLIPTPVGLDRSQTIRFGLPVVTKDGEARASRLCVAEGFMCGFDLQMPNNVFPTKNGARECPISASLPAPLNSQYQSLVGDTGKLLSELLGCQSQIHWDVSVDGWQTWTFEFGMLAMAVGDPAGNERTAVAVVEEDIAGRRLRVRWKLPGHGHDWFNVHAYNLSVAASSGDAPSGDAVPSLGYGDVSDKKTLDKGEVVFGLNDVQDTTWHVLVEGCDSTFWSHECRTNVLPRLSVNVAPRPKQSFSCGAHMDREQGIVLELGSSCSDSPYGLFIYVWSKPCSKQDECPEGATNFGFVVVAPSRGWDWDKFSDLVNISMTSYRASNGREYSPTRHATIAVPISPPAVRVGEHWIPTGPASSHLVTFRWHVPSGDSAAILADSGAPALFGVLAGDIGTWPTAVGHVSAPDAPGAGSELIRSSGSGCFTVSGLPTLSDPDPIGLLVDLRNALAPEIHEPRSSTLAAACP